GDGAEEDGDEWAGAATTTSAVDAAALATTTSTSSSPPPPPSFGPRPAPEAWSGKKPWVDGNARVYSLPYSEHSSFTQLKDFVRAVRPKKIVPTVNAASSASVEKMLSHFLELMDLSSDRKRLDSYFCKRDSPATPAASVSVSGDSSTPGAAGRGCKAPSTPAEKRRRGATGVAAGTTRPPSVEKCSGPPSEAREANFRENGRTLGTPHRRQSLSTLTRHNGVGATRGKGNATRLAYGRVVSPCAVAVGGRRLAVASPDSAAGSRSAAAEPAVATSSGAVELDRVDVEAQKAIMADIERRKREQQQQQQQQQGHGRALVGEKQDRKADGAPSGHSSRGGAAEESRKADGSGHKPRGPSLARDRDNRPGGRTIGAAPPGVFGGGSVTCAAGTRKIAERADCDEHPQVVSIDDESDESIATSPMDIRDFFSRRG
ncbi:unnamed protein product, partial [Hapterophycus canaliculatus]